MVTVNPAISVSVGDQEICYDGTVKFTATPTGGTSPFTYEWKVDGTVQTETGNELTLANQTASAAISVTVTE